MLRVRFKLRTPRSLVFDVGRYGLFKMRFSVHSIWQKKYVFDLLIHLNEKPSENCVCVCGSLLSLKCYIAEAILKTFTHPLTQDYSFLMGVLPETLYVIQWLFRPHPPHPHPQPHPSKVLTQQNFAKFDYKTTICVPGKLNGYDGYY